MRRAVYPGSFDPVTNGHLDVIERASRLYDEVLVAIAHNETKAGLFSFAERVALLNEAVEHHPNVRVTQFDGLLVNFARKVEAQVIIRGLRAVSDFEYEFQMALMNRKLDGNVETMFLMPKEEYSYVSSRLVKEIARLGGDIEAFVPDCIVRALREKFPR
ncbi:MAG: pantetheine-phosphate adenylyltransferase [Verrucomicrobiota bacterium]